MVVCGIVLLVLEQEATDAEKGNLATIHDVFSVALFVARGVEGLVLPAWFRAAQRAALAPHLASARSLASAHAPSHPLRPQSGRGLRLGAVVDAGIIGCVVSSSLSLSQFPTPTPQTLIDPFRLDHDAPGLSSHELPSSEHPGRAQSIRRSAATAGAFCERRRRCVEGADDDVMVYVRLCRGLFPAVPWSISGWERCAISGVLSEHSRVETHVQRTRSTHWLSQTASCSGVRARGCSGAAARGHSSN
eukprot:2716190-Rhodomonas_salina.1